MNKISLFFLLVSLALGNLVNLSGSKCGEGSVPDPNKICIEPNYIEGCLTYKSVDTCSVCQSAYSLDTNGRCDIDAQLTAVTIPGCLEITSGQCTNCANGFQRVNGVCNPGVKYCETYNTDGSCQTCRIEYSLIINECKHNYLLGCKTEQGDHTCTECYSPFTLTNYQCVIPNCKSLNDFGCVACECGYYLNANQNCQPMADGCLKYTNGVCTQCLPHYKLKGGSCAIQGCLNYSNQVCTKCTSLYNNVDGECEFKDCIDWQNDQCFICKQGFNLVNGICVQITEQFTCK